VKPPGSIRSKARNSGRTVPDAKNPRIHFPMGTALPGPALTSGPGAFLAVWPLQSNPALKSVPTLASSLSYLVPLERKSCLGVARRDFHEQGFAI
jgi:hypothetical protein